MDKVITVIPMPRWGDDMLVALCPNTAIVGQGPPFDPHTHWLGYHTGACIVCTEVGTWRRQKGIQNSGLYTMQDLPEYAARFGYTIHDSTEPDEDEIRFAVVEIKQWLHRYEHG